jgi:hypothetical protein
LNKLLSSGGYMDGSKESLTQKDLRKYKKE